MQDVEINIHLTLASYRPNHEERGPGIHCSCMRQNFMECIRSETTFSHKRQCKSDITRMLVYTNYICRSLVSVCITALLLVSSLVCRYSMWKIATRPAVVTLVAVEV